MTFYGNFAYKLMICHNMSKKTKIDFKAFLKKFPSVEMPVTISDEVSNEFSKRNDPLPMPLIEQYILSYEEEEPDDMTEFVPCFKIKGTKKMDAVVYWKAGLMTYEYVLITFSPMGDMIDRRVIAGTKVENEVVVKSVATIDEDFNIFVVGGVNKDGNEYNPGNSQSVSLQLLQTGKIAVLN